MADLFTAQQWAGVFFLPDLYEQRFYGEVHYSPEKGVTFHYTIVGNEIPQDTQVLHGVLSTGDKCTLLGNFHAGNSGFTTKNDLLTRPGGAGFLFFAIGDFLSSDEHIGNIDFSLTNLQEFFFASGFKEFVKYSDSPMYSLGTSFGKMEVRNVATFGFVGSDITSQFHSFDPTALQELSQAFEEISARHPKSFFMLKKDIVYRIFLEFAPTIVIREAYEHISNFSDLFALLTYCPVYPESIQLKKPGTGENSVTVQLYPSIVLDSRTIGLITQRQPHFDMPITRSSISPDSVASAWLQSSQNSSPIVTSIQHETGFRTTHATHGDIVLYASQLESISYSCGHEKDKYEYPLTTYGSDKIRDDLMKIFGVSSLQVMAQAVGDLRNDIAHVKRPKQWLTKLSLGQLVGISQCLQLAIIGYLLTNLGVPVDVVRTYQDRYAPDI